MASKEDKEAALNARIAAIRAQNEARERRHREIEADRREAERNKSAVKLKAEEEEIVADRGGGFRNPFESSGKVLKKPVYERTTKSREEQPSSATRRGRGRLADDDGPPPDPGYSFLADRMRDGSPEEDQDSRREQRGPRNTGKVPLPRPKKETIAAKKSSEMRSPRQQQDENSVSPKHRSAGGGGGGLNRNHRQQLEDRVSQNIRDIRDDTSSRSNVKPLMPELRQLNSSSKPTNSAQARLERSRNNLLPLNTSKENGADNNYHNPNRKVTETTSRGSKIQPRPT